MKKLNFIAVFLCGLFIFSVKAQVGIGTDKPHSSAILDISSENKVLLLPRIDDISSIESPPEGSFIYDTNRQCISYYKNDKWRCLVGGKRPGFTINGDPFVGNMLTAEATGFDIYRKKDVSFTYKWYRADSDEGLREAQIADATDKTYILTDDDYNKYITVEAIPEDKEYGYELKADYTAKIGKLLVDIPDEKFKEYLKREIPLAFNDDDKMKANSELVKTWPSINVRSRGITSLEGIEYFTGLTSLTCGSNQLTELDVTKNTALTSLTCGSNQLTELDVTKNTALTSLSANSNQLTELDVTKNTALTSLSANSNQLTELDVTKNTALTHLYCSYNDLTELDLKRNTALRRLNCSHNNLIWLDIRFNTLLRHYPQVSCEPLNSHDFTVVKWHDNWK